MLRSRPAAPGDPSPSVGPDGPCRHRRGPHHVHRLVHQPGRAALCGEHLLLQTEGRRRLRTDNKIPGRRAATAC